MKFPVFVLLRNTKVQYYITRARHWSRSISTEQVGLAVTLWSFIPALLTSNLVKDTGYPDWCFSDFPQTLQENSRIVPRSGNEHFLLSFVILPTDVIQYIYWQRRNITLKNKLHLVALCFLNILFFLLFLHLLLPLSSERCIYDSRLNSPNTNCPYFFIAAHLEHCWNIKLTNFMEPPFVQLLKNFPAFYGTRRFITVFTRALHCSLSWARSIQ
jgi:hypothetical protein